MILNIARHIMMGFFSYDVDAGAFFLLLLQIELVVVSQ